MSYDLMVFDPSEAPIEREKFMAWYRVQTEWSEEHGYDDPKISSQPLQDWFQEMVQHFPMMNGPCVSDDIDEDDPRLTDHCVGKVVIYSAFAWSCAEDAYPIMRELAIKHNVGFFDVSAENGEILFPEKPASNKEKSNKPWWKFW